VPVRVPARKKFPDAKMTNTDFYPGHDGYLFIANELLASIKKDSIFMPQTSVTTSSSDTVTGASVKTTPNRAKHNDTPIPFYMLTVDDLVKSLVDRFWYDARPPTNKSNWEWCDPDLTILQSELRDKLKEALTSPQGFPSYQDPAVNPLGFRNDSWDTWAGTHWGLWLADNGQDYLDTAVWEETTPLPTADPADLLDSTTGKPRVYDHQHVTWLERKTFEAIELAGDGKQIINHAEHGWNNSHPDVAYLWGWDPKELWEWDNKKRLLVPVWIKYPGTWGVHVGFPFLVEEAEDDIRFILWLTPTEVFLETVNLSKQASITINPKKTQQYTNDPKWVSETIPDMNEKVKLGHPKSSTALNGRGQWVIQ
jgi:hypothetical protein